MPQVRPQKGAGDHETAVMNTRSDNPTEASPRAAARTLYEATGEVPRRGVRTADMVKAGIAATTREFNQTIHAGRPTARPDKDLHTEEIG
jgi:hypothetical protein